MTKSEASAIVWHHCGRATIVSVHCYEPGVALVLVTFSAEATRDEKAAALEAAQADLRERAPLGIVVRVQEYR